MLILDIGNTKTKVYDDCKKSFYCFDNKKFDEWKNNLLINQDIYIGSVNIQISNLITDFLEKNNHKYTKITHNDFIDYVKINNTIDFNEVGLDLLALVYSVHDEENFLFINSGTALVYINYTNKIEGVIISNNVFYDFDQLIKKTGLNYTYNYHDNFGINTDEALSAGISLTFSVPLKYLLLSNKQIKKIYYCNINSAFFKNFSEYSPTCIEYATLKGYIKIVEQKWRFK